MQTKTTKNLVVGFSLALAAFATHAFQISSLSPQGEVARVRQVQAKFDDSAINFGDPKAEAPLSLQCNDAQAAKGSGRWVSDRAWAYEFDRDLPPGVSCSVQLKAGLQSVKGVDFSGPASYRFSTGGPFVQTMRPYEGARIDEEQFFLLRLSGEASTASLLAHMWCAVDGLGERVAVRLIEGKDRAELLKSQRWDKEAAKSPLSFVTLACNRRLSADARVQLVFDKGVATPGGIANMVEKRFSFQVREPFDASFACEREKAQSACLPIRPMTLSFNAPVSKKLLEGIRLVSDKESFKPIFGASDNGDEGDEHVLTRISFGPVLPELTAMRIELPKEFRDASGRNLRNAGNFPLKVATAAMPPLAKFAAAPFGIVERFAEPNGMALLPVTLRNVEAALKVQGLNAAQTAPATKPAPANSKGQVSDFKPGTDAEIIAWFQKIQRYDNMTVPRNMAARDSKLPLPPSVNEDDRSWVQTRMVSLVHGQPNVKTLDLPTPANNDPRPFEVVGIPLDAGFHVVEIASQKLGASLLDERYGNGRTMFVRTSALVTNLGVHFKLGRENALAWVTTLDKGVPVAGATVRVSDCRGREVTTGKTDTQGVTKLEGVPPQAPSCDLEGAYSQAYFVSARAEQPTGYGKGMLEDLAFTWSDWNKGIEPWRFNLPTSQEVRPDERAHTILDRSLFRAGETVSMKHILRAETSKGFGLSATLPQTLVVTHQGSGQQYAQPLTWRKTATGGQSAESSFAIPQAAKLGVYSIELRGAGNERTFYTSQFRVEEFRLPVLEGRVAPEGKEQLVNAKTVPVDVQVNYVSGGPAANLPVRLSALVRAKYLNFADFDAFSFSPPRGKQETVSAGDEETESSNTDSRVIADKLPLTLDKNGAGKTTIADVPPNKQPQDLLLEATYSDPNGEVQTIHSTRTLWPAAVVAGIKTEGWVSSGKQIKFHALALDLAGKAKEGVELEVKATARIVTTTRKRMVGGFYTYDNKTTVKDLGSVCSGKSDSRGLMLCDATLSEPGEVELVVTAKDANGNSIQAASSVYVTKQGELWFGGENNDRIDLLPEKKTTNPARPPRFRCACLSALPLPC
jgi:hypothetical protein